MDPIEMAFGGYSGNQLEATLMTLDDSKEIPSSEDLVLRLFER
jgi:hypothetical protein